MKLSQATKEAKERIKQKNEKEHNEMSKLAKFKTPLVVVSTIVLTLGVVFAAYSLYMSGYAHGANDQKQISAEVANKLAALKTSQK